jgi:hypothetical protein
MRPTALNEHLSVLLDDEEPLLAPLPPAAALGYWQDAAKARTSIPFRQLRQDHRAPSCWPPCRPPRTPVLCRVLAVTSALLLLLHMVSCGLFFCVTLPFQRPSYVDLSELLAEPALLRGSGGAGAAGGPGGSQHRAPKLIPRIIHQTFSSRQVPESAKAIMRSWREHNGNGWQIRFYDDQACLDFVRREFPEYLDAYRSLPKDVERSDFFRYMVVLRLGGVYADIDVECRQPLDRVIRPTDTMVVGWEAEVATDALAYKRHFARKRQVLQWFFAAAPGHPALRQICEHIAANAQRSFSNNTNRDTLERTGPGIWTDVVLRHSMRHPMHKVRRGGRPAPASAGCAAARRPPPAALAPRQPGSRPACAARRPQLDDPYKVRVLPRVAFGVHPAGGDGLAPDALGIVTLHHFMGSWKVRGGARLPAGLLACWLLGCRLCRPAGCLAAAGGRPAGLLVWCSCQRGRRAAPAGAPAAVAADPGCRTPLLLPPQVRGGWYTRKPLLRQAQDLLMALLPWLRCARMPALGRSHARPAHARLGPLARSAAPPSRAALAAPRPAGHLLARRAFAPAPGPARSPAHPHRSPAPPAAAGRRPVGSGWRSPCATPACATTQSARRSSLPLWSWSTWWGTATCRRAPTCRRSCPAGAPGSRRSRPRASPRWSRRWWARWAASSGARRWWTWALGMASSAWRRRPGGTGWWRLS